MKGHSVVTEKQLDELCINTIRTVSMDAVQQANSGHPGTPMAMAPVVYCLWQRFLRFDPDDPIWPKGGYVLADADDGKPDVLFMASGSEVQLCIDAYKQLKGDGIKARVVSLPSWELFEQQSSEYRDSVIPPEVKACVSVEQVSTFGWARFVGRDGRRIGMRTFGASAPLKELQKKFGFNTEAVVTAAKEMLQKPG
jgi:transketolase